MSYACWVGAVWFNHTVGDSSLLKFKFVANYGHRKGQTQNYLTGRVRKNESREKKRDVDVVGGWSPQIKVMHISVQFYQRENVISVEERTVAPFD